MAPPRPRCRRGAERWRANQRLWLSSSQLNCKKSLDAAQTTFPGRRSMQCTPPPPPFQHCSPSLPRLTSHFLGPVSRYPGTPASRRHGTDTQTYDSRTLMQLISRLASIRLDWFRPWFGSVLFARVDLLLGLRVQHPGGDARCGMRVCEPGVVVGAGRHDGQWWALRFGFRCEVGISGVVQPPLRLGSSCGVRTRTSVLCKPQSGDGGGRRIKLGFARRNGGTAALHPRLSPASCFLLLLLRCDYLAASTGSCWVMERRRK